MTNQEILTKAIKKAIDGGWEEQGIKWMFQLHELVDIDDFDMSNSNNFNVLIFNHQFAKALWPKKNYIGFRCEHCGLVSSFQDEYRHHLQMMVVADDPIKYLGDNL